MDQCGAGALPFACGAGLVRATCCGLLGCLEGSTETLAVDKKKLSETDICAKFVTPALDVAGWDESEKIYREYTRPNTARATQPLLGGGLVSDAVA